MIQNILNGLVEISAKKDPFFFFVQIGACDGILTDPIHELIKKHGNWKGLLIEPQKREFERLKKTYEGRGFIFENVAITDRKEIRKLYKPKGEMLDADWKRGIASLVPQKNFMANYIKNGEYEIEEVECETLKNLNKKYCIEKINLLQIDAEGFDYEIIKTISFNELKPEIIHFEYFNLGKQESEECDNLLSGQGYCILKEGGDKTAVLRKNL